MICVTKTAWLAVGNVALSSDGPLGVRFTTDSIQITTMLALHY